jgi:hypothetical protein
MSTPAMNNVFDEYLSTTDPKRQQEILNEIGMPFLRQHKHKGMLIEKVVVQVERRFNKVVNKKEYRVYLVVTYKDFAGRKFDKTFTHLEEY